MAAHERGVEVVVGGVFAADPGANPRAVRVCLSHESSRARVQAGLMILAELLESPDPPAPMIL
jgi:DNA-binding transcriptional MocR family regulator